MEENKKGDTKWEESGKRKKKQMRRDHQERRKHKKRGERKEREASTREFFSSKDIMVCDKTKQDTVKAKKKNYWNHFPSFSLLIILVRG